jgi:hypothetical protein
MKYGGLPFGRKIDADRPGDYLGTVRTLAPADAETVRAARRFFIEAKEDDFDREGRVWVDRGSGLRYRRVDGAPLAASDPRRQASLFAVVDGSILFLPHEGEQARVEVVEVGTMGAHEAAGHEADGVSAGGDIW